MMKWIKWITSQLYDTFLNADFIFLWTSLWNATDVLFQTDQGKNVASALMGTNLMVPIKSQTMSQNSKVYDIEMNLISVACIRTCCKIVTIFWWVENLLVVKKVLNFVKQKYLNKAFLDAIFFFFLVGYQY